MDTLRDVLRRIYDNLNTLEERKVRSADRVELELLNAIEDLTIARDLLEQELQKPAALLDVDLLKAELKRLLIPYSFIERINFDELKAEIPLLPFEPETILIPAGPFSMGSDTAEPDEAPQHTVTLAAYRIGKYPVTNAQYAAFLGENLNQAVPRKAGWSPLREPPPAKLDHPVVGISWHDAWAYCAWLSQRSGRSYRLPSEAQWEKAAAGDASPRQYPWGDAFIKEYCNSVETGLDDTSAVGQFSPGGDSPFGCADMAGNVQEWVNTLWGSELEKSSYPYPYQSQDRREETAPDNLYRVYRIYRGGSFRDEAVRLRCSARGRYDPDSKSRWRGFRVVRDI